MVIHHGVRLVLGRWSGTLAGEEVADHHHDHQHHHKHRHHYHHHHHHHQHHHHGVRLVGGWSGTSWGGSDRSFSIDQFPPGARSPHLPYHRQVQPAISDIQM